MLLPESFFEVAQAIYQDDPNWLGEQAETIKVAFSDNHDYLKKGGKVWADAVVNPQGEVARLAGFYDPAMNIEGAAVAYFGFWETSNHSAPNTSLFQRFEAWAKAQGAEVVYGPINFNTYGLNRIRLFSEEEEAEGGETASFIGEPYNPDYYSGLLDDLGYNIRYRYFTRITNNPSQLAEVVAPMLERGKQALQGEFEFHRFNGDLWRQKLDQLYPITDRMFRNNFAYSPITKEQFVASCGEPFAKKLCPLSSVLVTDKRGDIAGYFLVFPDYSPLIRQGLATADNVNFDQHFDQLPYPRMALAKTGAVHPDYRKAGLFTLMSMQLTLWGEPYYQRIAGALVREDNPSLKYARNGEQQRVYALYQKSLKEDAQRVDASEVGDSEVDGNGESV